jgi:hypothetical protein
VTAVVEEGNVFRAVVDEAIDAGIDEEAELVEDDADILK